MKQKEGPKMPNTIGTPINSTDRAVNSGVDWEAEQAVHDAIIVVLLPFLGKPLTAESIDRMQAALLGAGLPQLAYTAEDLRLGVVRPVNSGRPIVFPA